MGIELELHKTAIFFEYDVKKQFQIALAG